MTQATPVHLPLQGLQAGFRRFTVPEYHNLIRIGVLTEDDNLELIEGYLVHKMSRNPPHDGTILRLNNRLVRLLPSGWQAEFSRQSHSPTANRNRTLRSSEAVIGRSTPTTRVPRTLPL